MKKSIIIYIILIILLIISGMDSDLGSNNFLLVNGEIYIENNIESILENLNNIRNYIIKKSWDFCVEDIIAGGVVGALVLIVYHSIEDEYIIYYFFTDNDNNIIDRELTEEENKELEKILKKSLKELYEQNLKISKRRLKIALISVVIFAVIHSLYRSFS